jgi:hypothetical protein
MIVSDHVREEITEQGDTTLDGCYCIKTDAFYCSCRTRPWSFVHHEQQIIVWREKDNKTILKLAQTFKEHDFNPKIIEYEAMMGKAIDWEDIPPGDIH